MIDPRRIPSETPDAFDGRLDRFRVALREQDRDCVLVDAADVYASGVCAGLSLAVAALQRRERIIDHLSRWEHRRDVERRARYGR